MNLAYGSDAKLHVKISGPINDNRYFLCVSHAGCASILNANKGKVFPMDQGVVNNIVVLNLGSKSLHPQKLPESCQVTVTPNQTVTVTGKLVQGAKNKVVLSNLRCSVS